MEPSQTLSTKTTEDLSLYGLFSLFISNWLILCVCGISFAAIAVIWAVQQPNQYKAETVLMPTADEKGGLGALAGSLGGLASVAGIGMSDSGNDNSKLALELIKSRAFIAEFIEQNDILVQVMAAQGWDIESKALIINPDLYDVTNKEWVRKVKAPIKQVPSLLEAHEKFLKMLKVEQEPKSKFVKLSIEYYSPEIAADWAQKLVELLNDKIRKMDMNEATESIAYLEKLIADSNVSGLRNVFSSLMEEQLKSKMLAEIRKDYVFKVVDPAIAPEKKSKPQRALIVIVAGFLGGIIGMIIILFRSGKQFHLATRPSK